VIPTDPRSPFGETLRRLRLRAGLSQEQLAERARLSAESIGSLERGIRRAPYRETVELIADALGASESEREELRTNARRPRKLPGAPSSPPPLPERAVEHNLPRVAGTLRGRERDLENLRRLIASEAVVTIAGAGGIGKTRLALALAAMLATEGSLDAIWFVELAPLGSSELVLPALERILGVAQTSTDDPYAGVAGALAGRRALVILDNCEHVLDAASAMAEALIRTTPGVRVLTTSRQPLRVPGEAVYRLASLAVPERGEGISADEALRYGSVALFADRASTVEAGFRLTDENARYVVEICANLDGIPLAIELAAARVNVLSVAGLAQRLNQRFRLLTGGNAAALPRQRTLSALIDWSYDLLTPRERSLLDRVAIFAGGFSLEAAAAVCCDEGSDAIDALDLLSSLVEKSLVVADTSRTPERYRLLESTQAYALDRLDANGERDSTAARHAEYFVRLARDADSAYGRSAIGAWLPPLELETDNFRRALQWTIVDGRDVPLGAAIAGSLERFWINGGLEVEGRRVLVAALERLDAAGHPAVAARAQRALAWLQFGEQKCSAARAASELYALVGDEAGRGDALRLLALGQAQLGEYAAALATNERALEIFRTTRDERNCANCLDMAAAIATQIEDFATARPAFEEALALFRKLGSQGGEASVLSGLATMEFLSGNPARALALGREGFALRRTTKQSTNTALDQMGLATYCIALGELDQAAAYARAALEAARGVHNLQATVDALTACGAIAVASGDQTRAARLYGYVEATSKRNGIVLDLIEQRLQHMLAGPLRDGLSPRALDDLAAEGALWSEERAAEEAGRGFPTLSAAASAEPSLRG
jgi:predicted ATPase/DNA-binding XRE family transcriptional regulator